MPIYSVYSTDLNDFQTHGNRRTLGLISKNDYIGRSFPLGRLGYSSEKRRSMARVGNVYEAYALTRSKQTEPAPGFARTKAPPSIPADFRRAK